MSKTDSTKCLNKQSKFISHYGILRDYNVSTKGKKKLQKESSTKLEI